MSFQPSCPIGVDDDDRVCLAHGEGGRRSRELLSRIFKWLDAASLESGGDAALVRVPGDQVAFTTDSYVVSPLFFPGGDIGTLAVNGTLNDLAVAGASPAALSLSLILEEGLPLATLAEISTRAGQAAADANVRIVTGDTKVVPRGVCDGLFINTSGVGRIVADFPGPPQLEPGDQLLVTGPIGRHGVAVLAARESLEFEPAPTSDCASLWPAIEALIKQRVPIKAIRDATRGGVAAVLHEWAASSGKSLVVELNALPESPATRGVAELLGLDLLHVACEGTAVLAIAENGADQAVDVLRQIKVSTQAAKFGSVIPGGTVPVAKRDLFGRLLAVDEPAGAPLPRIC